MTLTEFLLARIAEDEANGFPADARKWTVTDCATRSDVAGAGLTLRYFALPYSDHPDYLPEWKP